jgi:ATP-binding cassette subfamily B protein
MYWDMLRDGVQQIQDVFSDLAQAAGAAQRVFDLLDVHPDIPLRSGIELTREGFRGEIRFHNVGFTYQSRSGHPVLEGLDLNIPEGSTVAVVGKSGEGKTTAVHLLLRFYEPHVGCILIDGTPLKELNLKSFHDLIGFVSQDTKLCFGTIRDNLTYGLPWNPTDEEIDNAVRAANCLEFIQDMDEGYDTNLGEAGVKLSGGQRQRLSLCRAFLRKPRLLILDEATSHLDAENERLVQEGIDSLVECITDGSSNENSNNDDADDTRNDAAVSRGGRRGRCTVIIIAHRLSTVRNADTIAVLQNGTVEEQGTHEDLLARDGLYAKLVAKQEAKTAGLLDTSSK